MIDPPGRSRETHRLSRPSDYRSVFQSGRRAADAHFVILSRVNGLGGARLGLAISARHVASSVKRNTVKRVIRESFRRHHISLKGLDIVVMSNSGTGRADKRTLAASLSRLWKKVSPCDTQSSA